MDGILPPSAIPGAQAQLQQQQSGQKFGIEAQLNASQIQSKLPMGTLMLAQVVGNDKNGNLIVRTNGSDLLLSSPLAIAKGAQLQIRIDAVASGNVAVQLVSVDGKLPVYRPLGIENNTQRNQAEVSMKLLQVNSEGTLKAVQQNISQATTTPQKVDSVTLSTTQPAMIKAMVIQPSPEIMQGIRNTLSLSTSSEEKLIKTLPSELRPGMEANVKISSVISQSPKTTVQNTAQNPGTTPEQQKVDTSNTTLKGQDWMKPEANNLANQAKEFNPALKVAPNGNLQANALVLDRNKAGEMLVDTKLGLLRLDGQATSFPKGSELMLEVVEFVKTESTPQKHNPLHEIAKDWPTLKNLFAENQKEGTRVAGSQNNFGAKMVNFMNAVQSGNVEGWLGAEFLESLDDISRGNLVTKLIADFAQLKAMMGNIEGNTQNMWQTALFPVFDGQEMHNARLHVKRFKDESPASESGVGTRFIVDLETSRYGEMQFDGLVRRLAPRRSFDLIIRTQSGLDVETQQQIREIYNTTQEISGHAGSIEFAVNNHFPVEPWKALLDRKTSHDSLLG